MVTPPPEWEKKISSFAISAAACSTDMGYPYFLNAPVRHLSTQTKQLRHLLLSIRSPSPSRSRERAPAGHTFTHKPHLLHRSFAWPFSRTGLWDSGVEHQAHLRGHPLRKSTVRSPCPSCMDDLSI